MTKREPFAKQVISSCPPSHIAEGLKSATEPLAEDVRMGGCACGSCIDAAFESAVAERVREAVEEFRERAARVAEIDLPPGSTMIHGPHKSGSKEIAERIRALPAGEEGK